ncbi:hypothetical protein EKP23_08395, partial [Salmonella enterica]|nr:hypothetical protein [Salmonella enterica]EAZ9461283.1 hypothetical protein [Salmonella enterica]
LIEFHYKSLIPGQVYEIPQPARTDARDSLSIADLLIFLFAIFLRIERYCHTQFLNLSIQN